MTTHPRFIAELETPAVLIDIDRLERNIASIAERAARAAHALRPHAKTHKVPEIARLQRQAGARGLSVAKPAEAEIFADHGFLDLFVAYPVVAPLAAARLVALSQRVERLIIGVDSVAGATSLGAPFAAQGKRVEARLKIDCGFHRVGVLPEHAVAVGCDISRVPGIQLTGVFTHAGQAYHRAKPDAIRADANTEAIAVTEAARALRSAGVPIADVSTGSTPTSRYVDSFAGVTEMRPGNYVYLDRTQAALGTATLDDCAMTVLATVVSVSGDDRAVIDAGSKSLSTDTLRPHADGYGLVVGTKSRLARLSEEHGVIEVEPGDRFAVGDRVRVLPNHACVVSNLHDRVVVVRGEHVEAVWNVAARGKLT